MVRRPRNQASNTASSGAGTDPASFDAPDVDEDELDEKWGFGRQEPLVGFGAPPVVAVLVTSNPGDWFEETLESLADQDYESLSVLVLDNASTVDPTQRIAEVLPSAFVKRIESDHGFSAAANEVLVSVEGAAFYLLLHDDVRLAENTVTALVSEAFRATGGIVGPKIVDWDDPTRLRSVGYSVDIYGFASSVSEPGELDQSQHDTAREVFAVSDACMLIRSDLFSAIGGFNEDLPFFGEDIDLCWRAHIADATVHLCPNAVVAHRERFGERRDAENRERLELRHEARTMLTNYEPFRLLRIAPVAAMLSAVDLLGSLVVGRFRRAGDITASWLWNLVNVPSLFRARSRVKRSRRTHDAKYLPLMRQGSSRLNSLLRAEEGENKLQAVAQVGRGYLTDLTTGPSRSGAALAAIAAVIMLIGARDLIAGPLPVLREFIDAGPSAGRLLSEWWTGWRESGLGEPAVAPGVVPGLGVVGTILLGSVGLARRLLILLPLLIGGLGAWKLFLRAGSVRARAAMLVAYGLNPVVLNAMAEGRLQALVTYAAAPWLVRRTALGAGVAPFGDDSTSKALRPRHLAGTALILAVVAAVTPLGAALLVVCVLVLSLAPLFGGQRGLTLKMALSVLLSAVLALPVVLPWLIESVMHGDAASLTGIWTGRDATPSAAEIITGSVGPVSVGLFGWGLLVAGGYSLLAGRSWRLGWALGGWVLAMLSWVGTIWLAQSDSVAGAGVELLLIPAVLGLAISVAMGALAFEHDVIGSDFGISQVLSGVAVVGLFVSMVPIGVASVEGRWYQPEGDFRRLLEVVDDGTDFRTVWIGDPDVLPLSGWPLDSVEGLSIGTSDGLEPLVTQRYRLDGGSGVEALSDAVDAAIDGQTSRLGRILGPMGVRYVVVVDGPAPQPYATREAPVPVGAVSALREQLDLSEIELNENLALFEVDGTWPLRSDITDLELPDGGEVSAANQLQSAWPVPPAVLGRSTGTRFSGELEADRQIAQSVTADPGWSLTVDGDEADRSGLLGWQQQFATPAGGSAELRWSTPISSRVLQLVQVLGLIALVVIAGRRRHVAAPTRRRRRAATSDGPLVVLNPDGEAMVPTDDDPWVAPTTSGAPSPFDRAPQPGSDA